MAWDEWEQLKAAAFERQLAHTLPGRRPATGTGPVGPVDTVGPGGAVATGGAVGTGGPGRNVGPGGNVGAGGPGTLRHTHGPWSLAAGALDDLHTSTGRSATELTSAHNSMTSETTGLASAGVLEAVLTSWERRIADVRSECRSLGPHVRQVATDMAEVDLQVGCSVGSVTMAAGGAGGVE